MSKHVSSETKILFFYDKNNSKINIFNYASRTLASVPAEHAVLNYQFLPPPQLAPGLAKDMQDLYENLKVELQAIGKLSQDNIHTYHNLQINLLGLRILARRIKENPTISMEENVKSFMASTLNHVSKSFNNSLITLLNNIKCSKSHNVFISSNNNNATNKIYSFM